jgi:hypothetical protein
LPLTAILTKAMERLLVERFDDLADHVPLAGDFADNVGLSAAESTLASAALVTMPVPILATDEGFVHFQDADELSELCWIGSGLHRSQGRTL